MLVKCSEIIKLMEKFANPILAETWDNIGLIIGDKDAYVKKILVALDIDDNVVFEAINKKCEMIITHHPPIFKPLKTITTSNNNEKRIFKLIQNNISVFSAHTNLDCAENGTSDTLAKMLSLQNIQNLFENKDFEFGLGRVGNFIKPILLIDVISNLKKILNIEKLIFCGDLNKIIYKVAICTGAGGEIDFIKQAKQKNCDLYITGDVKYHNAQFANDLNLALIDASHYFTERLIIPIICKYLSNCLKTLNLDIEIVESDVNGQILNII